MDVVWRLLQRRLCVLPALGPSRVRWRSSKRKAFRCLSHVRWRGRAANPLCCGGRATLEGVNKISQTLMDMICDI